MKKRILLTALSLSLLTLGQAAAQTDRVDEAVALYKSGMLERASQILTEIEPRMPSATDISPFAR